MNIVWICLCLDVLSCVVGTEWKVTSILNPPFLMKKKGGSSDQYEGYTLDLLNALAKQVNFTYKLHLVPDGKYGMKDTSGNWNGMIGEVTDKKADFAAGDLTVTEERKKAVLFSDPIYNNYKRILISKPTVPEHNGLKVLFEPFSVDVWVMLMVVCMLVGVLLSVIDRFSPSEWSKISPEEDKTNAKDSFNVNNALFFVHSTICWQGFREVPRSPGGRMLTSMWMSFTLFMITAYTANLAAFLVARTPDKPVLPFKTFHQMELQSSVSYGMSIGTEMALKNSGNDVYQRISYISKSDPGNTFKTTNEAIQMIKSSDGKFAAILDSSYTDYITGIDCELLAVGENAMSTSYALACDKLNQNLCNDLSDGLKAIKTEVEELKKKWWTGSCAKMTADEYLSRPELNLMTPAKALNMADLSIAFILLLLGIVVGCILLVVEVFLTKRRAKNLNETQQPLKMQSKNGDNVAIEGATDEEKAPMAADEP